MASLDMVLTPNKKYFRARLLAPATMNGPGFSRVFKTAKPGSAFH